MLGSFAFFAAGELISHTGDKLAMLWSFFSPLQWVASLVLVMTGQGAVVDEGLMQVTHSTGHGLSSLVVSALLAGLVGTMLCVSARLFVNHARQSSELGGKLFLASFAPIWTSLVLYRPLSEQFAGFRDHAAWLEQQAYEVRLSLGFGILLMAVVVPILALLCTKVLELILQPEKGYSQKGK
jgi:hypothetical protein